MRQSQSIWSLIICVVILAARAGQASVAGAEAKQPLPHAVRLHVQLRPLAGLASGEVGAVTDGRYVLFGPAKLTAGFLGTLLDTRTGTMTNIALPSSCTPEDVAIGGSRILVNCALPYRNLDLVIYSISSRSWRPVTAASQVTSACTGETSCTIAVGSHWIDFSIQCYHCGPNDRYQNLANGQVRSISTVDPGSGPTGRKTINLNSPALLSTLCSPINDPKSGTATQDGRTVIIESHNNLDVQRCGSRKQVLATRLPGLISFTDSTLVWTGGEGFELRGLALGPHPRAFEFPVSPNLLDQLQGYVVAQRDIFLTTPTTTYEGTLPDGY
jgi:hypothetical protein